MSAPKPGSGAWRRDHGISDAVWKARGYLHHAKGELGPIRDAFADCAPNQLAWAENKAKQESGLVMPAHALPGLAPIPPQLRPDNPIKRWVLHFHPAKLPPDGTVVETAHPKTGKTMRLVVRVVHEKRGEHEVEDIYLEEGGKRKRAIVATAWEMRRHIVSDDDHGKALAAELGYETPTDRHRLCGDPACRDDLGRVLTEANNPLPHWRQVGGKYLLTIAPTMPLEHDHADYVWESARRRHIRKYHGGVDVVGRHVHDGNQYPRTKPVKDDEPYKRPGRRLDCLLLAWERLAAAEFLVFILEGKLKADAALSHIIERDLPGSVVNVPSIGQWNAEELDSFLDRLAVRPAPPAVVIVVDSDADGNDQVMTQGLLLRSRIEEHGLRVCLAAPPPDQRPDVPVEDRFAKVGLDDHLGALARNFDDLGVINFDVPRKVFEAWKRRHARRLINGRRTRCERVERDARTLRGLILLGGATGRTTASLRKVARFVGFVDPIDAERSKQVERAVQDLIETGEVESDGPLTTRRWLYRTSTYRDPDFDFVERGLTITDPNLRAVELPRTRLGDWLHQEGEMGVTTMDAWHAERARPATTTDLDHMEARIAETLLRLQQTVDVVAARFAGEESVEDRAGRIRAIIFRDELDEAAA